MYCNVIHTKFMDQKTTIVTLRLSAREAKRVAAVQELTRLDKATLLRDFIEDGLRKRVLAAYEEGTITAQAGADMLDMRLREFLALLEREGISVNWDSQLVHKYMVRHYG
jgi:predicted HTH domain antitoxin